MASERLGIPLFRAGFPIFDRLGAQDRCWVGYRGTRQLVFEVANLFQSQLHAHKPEDFARADSAEATATVTGATHEHRHA
jgi:nitrogenase molybdenum-iron protein NifN